MISEKAVNYIQLLLKQPLLYIDREADMIDIGFGQYIPFVNHRGEYKKSPKYALHLQCSFRLISRISGIIVTSSDIYLDENGKFMQECKWDKLNANRYDIILSKWKFINKDLVVEDISINNCGDLFIVLNNEYVIEVFVNNSTDDECWRLFSNNIDEEHLVVSGVGDTYE
ncbi:MAG TPA: hypothetical protein RWO09_07695 [Ruminococcus sp.]